MWIAISNDLIRDHQKLEFAIASYVDCRLLIEVDGVIYGFCGTFPLTDEFLENVQDSVCESLREGHTNINAIVAECLNSRTLPKEPVQGIIKTDITSADPSPSGP